MEKPSKKLYGLACPFNSLGQFSAKLTLVRTCKQGFFFVLKGLKSALLGFSTISSLKLIQTVCATQSDEKGHAIK